MRITQWGDYGVRCSLYLAMRSNDGPIGSVEIAKSLSLPIKYAQQILHRIRRAGVVRSVRGPDGGFLLARNASEITVKDILYAAEGHSLETPAKREGQSVTPFDVPMDEMWQGLRGTIDNWLGSQTLMSLLEKARFEPVRTEVQRSVEPVQQTAAVAEPQVN